MNCPICGYHNLDYFLQRNQVPVYQNLLFSDPIAARNIDRGDLKLMVCNDCGFVFNAAFEPIKLQYGVAYDNNQIHSDFFQNYVDRLISDLLTDSGLRHSTIVEVGCGKGYFLRKLVEGRFDNIGYGFDPSYIGPEKDLDGRLRFEKRLFNSQVTDINADAVICRHVVEHLPDPVQLLKSIRKTLRGSSNPRVFLETPCVGWILENQVGWDFFYEHCSYFSMNSLKVAVERSGFKVRRVRHVFEGQYLWFEATTENDAGQVKTDSPAEISRLCRRFASRESSLLKGWRASLGELAEIGPVALWGAGAKGVTLANLVDPDRKLIACVVDLNPRKQGGFLPGTGHPIINYLDLPFFKVKNIVLMNPNYATENYTLLHNAQLKVALIDPTAWREIK